MPARKLTAILESSADLIALGEQARRTDVVQQAFREIAPAELAMASRCSLTRMGVIFIVADNGATAAKLRQLSTRILQGFRIRGFECTGTRVEVQADSARAPVPALRPRQLSVSIVRLLQEASREASPSPLKTALTRMARRHATRLEGSLQDVEQDKNDSRDHREP